jgi:hypothetical protein
MNVAVLIDRMERTPVVVRTLVSGMSRGEATYKPPSGAWSILEIVNHLADEDSDDFRARLGMILTDPAAPWPGTDPEGWAVRRKYQERDLAESISRFEKERAESLRWLRSLKDADWEATYLHPNHGPVKAGELMVSWPAHDALHIRQIAKRLYELAGREGAREGYSTRYAGEWGA